MSVTLDILSALCNGAVMVLYLKYVISRIVRFCILSIMLHSSCTHALTPTDHSLYVGKLDYGKDFVRYTSVKHIHSI